MVLVRSLGVALIALLIAAPAAAQTDPSAAREAAAMDALVALRTEVLLLVELDALDAVPPSLAGVHSEWVGHTNGSTRNAQLRWLYEVDAAGADALDALTEHGARATPALAAALGRIGSEDRLALEAGDPISIPAAQYVAALRSLADLVGAEAVSDRPLGVAGAPQTGDTATAAASAATDRIAAGEPVGASAEYPWAAVTLALVGVLFVGIVMVLFGRRRQPEDPVKAVYERLLDAGRRMAGALDREQIAEIAVGEATDLAHAPMGAFVEVTPHGLRAVHQRGDVLGDDVLGSALLTQVASTGRIVRAILNDDHALASLPAAVLALPVIGRGTVSGVILLARRADSPFSDAEEQRLRRLAPMIGSALATADIHGDIAELTRTDPLTGLGNRRSLDADLGGALMGLAAGSTLALVMVDVDYFKQFNDANGHAAGDQALQGVAEALRAHIRFGDLAYRYGGEEFTLLLRGVSVEQAAAVAERVREAVREIPIVGAELQPAGCLTVSLGIAVVSGGDVDEVIARADEALYVAKRNGRDRVVIAGHSVSA